MGIITALTERDRAIRRKRCRIESAKSQANDAGTASPPKAQPVFFFFLTSFDVAASDRPKVEIWVFFVLIFLGDDGRSWRTFHKNVALQIQREEAICTVIRNALIHMETSQLECCISETRELVSRSPLAPPRNQQLATGAGMNSSAWKLEAGAGTSFCSSASSAGQRFFF